MRELGDLLKELDKGGIYVRARALKAEIPASGQVQCDMASVLQTKCALITADLSELIARSELYAEKAKRLRDDCLSDKTTASPEKSEAAKSREAKGTGEYRALADERVVAKVLLNHVSSYKKFFDNMVYVMRSKQEKEARDWQSTPTSEV